MELPATSTFWRAIVDRKTIFTITLRQHHVSSSPVTVLVSSRHVAATAISIRHNGGSCMDIPTLVNELPQLLLPSHTSQIAVVENPRPICLSCSPGASQWAHRLSRSTSWSKKIRFGIRCPWKHNFQTKRLVSPSADRPSIVADPETAGTKWHPGENVGIGKDHSIYATESGYVRYYRDPARHPKRRYIGVALEKDGPGSQLPATPNAPTRRRLNMFATPMKEPQVFTVTGLSQPEAPQPTKNYGMTKYKPRVLIPTFLREGTNREANSSIGREAERKYVKVDGFDRKDRWQAWRKRATRLEAAVSSKAAKGTKKSKGKKSNKGVKIGGKKR